MNIGRNIRRFREARRMSLVALARKLDTHPSNVNRWEAGRVSPRWESVVRIAEALGVPVEELAAGVAEAEENLFDRDTSERLGAMPEQAAGADESMDLLRMMRVESPRMRDVPQPPHLMRDPTSAEEGDSIHEDSRSIDASRPRRRKGMKRGPRPEEPETTADTLARTHELRAEEYRQLNRFLRHPKFRELRAVIARLPEDLGTREIREVARLVERYLRGGSAGAGERGSGRKGD